MSRAAGLNSVYPKRGSWSHE